MAMKSLLASLFLMLLLSFSGFAQEGAVTPDLARTLHLSQDQIRDLIREAAERDIENDKKQRDYTYIQREEEHKLDGQDQVKSSGSTTYETMLIYEQQLNRRSARMDQPPRDGADSTGFWSAKKIIEK